jgi:hypothetical protein
MFRICLPKRGRQHHRHPRSRNEQRIYTEIQPEGNALRHQGCDPFPNLTTGNRLAL